MKQPLLVSGLLVAGLLCLGLGLGWGHLTSSEQYWSPQQADELTAAQADLHKKSLFRQNESEAQRTEFLAAKERFDQLTAQLESAQSSRSRTGTILKFIGVAALAAGALLHYQNKGAGD